jgi:hypothetical protein
MYEQNEKEIRKNLEELEKDQHEQQQQLNTGLEAQRGELFKDEVDNSFLFFSMHHAPLFPDTRPDNDLLVST